MKGIGTEWGRATIGWKEGTKMKVAERVDPGARRMVEGARS
jgi:hypothetical protein